MAVAAVPENYEDRLIEMLPGAHRHLRLMALDPYDIALSKLERNSRKVRDDVRFLGQSIPFDLQFFSNATRRSCVGNWEGRIVRT